MFLACLSVCRAQVNDRLEQFPMFPECAEQQENAEACFYNQVQQLVFTNFKVPGTLPADSVQKVIVLFEVDVTGKFNVLYVDAADAGLVAESKRIFNAFPKVSPPTYGGKPTYAKYTITFEVPLQDPGSVQPQPQKQLTKVTNVRIDRNKEIAEYDSIVYKRFSNPQFRSHQNIPFSHSMYSRFDDEMNQVGANNHTASKPFNYAEVSKYYDLATVNEQLKKDKSGWWGRKLWNENLVQIEGEDYWFTVNPIIDLQLGKSDPGEASYTYVNTRGIRLEGGLGESLNFTTTIFESQGRFADYFNRYAESIKASGGNVAVIPGIGIAKRFKDDAYDFPLAEANLSYTPGKFLNLNLGYGRNFIGDGYRSLLLSDGASPYPFVKINTSFWKIKYTNIYTWLKDVRPEVTVDGTYATKFMAAHYLSWNVTKKWNMGFFESVVWTNQNNRGFDMSFVNPIIFYRSVEFASSSRSGNAMLGLTTKYKWNNQINFYGQFLLDEFALADMKAGNKSWRNKYGYQLGVKYFNALNIHNLMLQLEYNNVRPYVYSHSEPLTNYGHNNQSLGHQWGGNFREFIAIARYHKGRYFADAKLTYGKRGLDFDTADNNLNYGGNIYKDYEEDRPFDTGVEIGQGNTTTVLIADLQAGYIINPITNLKLFGSLIYRNFDPMQDTVSGFKESTTWFSVGLRSDIFNWYFDY
jgi:hypothetical protein